MRELGLRVQVSGFGLRFLMQFRVENSFQVELGSLQV